MILKFDEMMTLAENRKELTAKREVVDGVPVVIFAYHVAFSDTFDSELAREFRGTTFREDTKECICRPFPKFFNVGEREDTQYGKINWSKAKFYTKHDGSMITPVLINDKVFLKTKKSFFSDVALKAQAFYETCGYDAGLVWDDSFMVNQVLPFFTPIYEYCGPQNQIVLPYEKEHFVYLGSRDIKRGIYRPAAGLLVPMASYEDIKVLENIEGYVVDDGTQLVKIKTEWYLKRHKIASAFNPKAIIQATLDNTVDDILGTISQLGMTLRFYQVSELRDKTLTEVFAVEGDIRKWYDRFKHLTDRKEFALTVNEHVPTEYKGAMFRMMDDRRYDDIVNKIVFNRVYVEEVNEL